MDHKKKSEHNKIYYFYQKKEEKQTNQKLNVSYSFGVFCYVDP